MFTFAKNLSRSLKARKAARELRGMPDFILKDIGISRSEIPFIVSREHPPER